MFCAVIHTRLPKLTWRSTTSPSPPPTSCLTHAVSSDPRQAAKTYLEKHYESFPTASLDDLIKHGLKALQVRKCGHRCGGEGRMLMARK